MSDQGRLEIRRRLPAPLGSAAESNQGGWGKMLDRLAGRMRPAAGAVATDQA